MVFREPPFATEIGGFAVTVSGAVEPHEMFWKIKRLSELAFFWTVDFFGHQVAVKQ